MRICLVTGIFPPDIGGPATYVTNLAEHLHTIGRHVEVITYADSPGPSDLPFQVHKVCRGHSSIRKFLRTRRLVKQVSRECDLVYINGLLFPAASALSRTRVPRLAKIVGDTVWERAQNNGLTELSFEEFQTSKQRGRIRMWQVLRNRSLDRMNRIIVPSEFLRKTVAGWGFGDKTEVIYNGITSSYGSEFSDVTSKKAKERLGLKGWVVLSVGRICRWKGFRAIIRSLTLLDKEICLVIAGDGPYKAELVKTATALGIDKRVNFVGRIDHNQLPLYFRAADCFVLNSGYEGFPHVVLEAMMMKCPVVAAACCGTPELIKDGVNGILIGKDNEHEIAQAIRSVRDNDELRASMTEQGLKDTSRFNWQNTADETVGLLESMV